MENFWSVLLSWVMGLLSNIIQLLPDADESVTMLLNEYTSAFRSGLESVSWIFPVDLLLLCISLVISVEVGLLVFKLIKWIMTHISIGFIKQ